jgi:hypothetical protein
MQVINIGWAESSVTTSRARPCRGRGLAQASGPVDIRRAGGMSREVRLVIDRVAVACSYAETSAEQLA